VATACRQLIPCTFLDLCRETQTPGRACSTVCQRCARHLSICNTGGMRELSTLAPRRCQARTKQVTNFAHELARCSACSATPQTNANRRKQHVHTTRRGLNRARPTPHSATTTTNFNQRPNLLTRRCTGVPALSAEKSPGWLLTVHLHRLFPTVSEKRRVSNARKSTKKQDRTNPNLFQRHVSASSPIFSFIDNTICTCVTEELYERTQYVRANLHQKRRTCAKRHRQTYLRPLFLASYIFARMQSLDLAPDYLSWSEFKFRALPSRARPQTTKW
jgi:hypothetical protein